MAPRPAAKRTLAGLVTGPLLVVGWVLLVLTGTAALVAGALRLGPPDLTTAGSVLVSAAYAWALAARTGGRPVVFGTLALVIGVVVLLVDREALRSGASVLTCSMSAVLAVMVTVPAVKVVHAAREVLIAFVVATIGAVAAVGYQPLVALGRFENMTLALALLIVFGLVYRLGAGFHGLGRRGLVAILVGGAGLGLAIAYAELLRLYGTPALVSGILDAASWSVANLGAVPRPMQALVGVPALMWGCHLRARRRQGWWACSFGVAGLVPITHVLADPAFTLLDSALTEVYSLVLGLLVGVLVIRVDLLLGGSRGGRANRAEQAAAVRPEARRTEPLL